MIVSLFSFFKTFLLFILCIDVAQAATLKTVGAYPCSGSGESLIQVTNFTFTFDKDSNNVTYYAEGYSPRQISVIANIQIFAYGETLLNERVNLCRNNVHELCPVPSGNVVISGVHTVPEKYTKAISAVAYKVPDIEGTVTIQLFNTANPWQPISCFSSTISNNVSTNMSSVKYATIGLAAAALVISGVSSAANAPSPTPNTAHVPTVSGTEGTAGGGTVGAPTSGPGTNVAANGFHAPGFTEFFTVIQSIAISGMYSVNYPPAYRKFTQNVAWSAGFITWDGMQESIDRFRQKTGGNLAESSFKRLQETTLIMGNQTDQSLNTQIIANSHISANIMKNTVEKGTYAVQAQPKRYVEIVSGIKAYVESMTIPNTNTFMTLLIWWAIIIAVCVAIFLGSKIFLELWCLKPENANKFNGFRKRYLAILNTTIVRVIVILYGIWVLYCLHQFKISDSWGVKVLAGVTLGLFSLVIIGYGLRICYLASKVIKQRELDLLFQHKPWIQKYGLFYDQFKIKFWWAFIPVFLCVFSRNAFLALGYGNGMVQVIGQLVVDTLLGAFFVICMPFNTKMGNGINLAIQVVRIISLVFLLTFTMQLDINRIAVTGVGMTLIVIQAALVISLAVLIFVNAVIGLINILKNNKQEDKDVAGQVENGNTTVGSQVYFGMVDSRDEKQNTTYDYNSCSISEPSMSSNRDGNGVESKSRVSDGTV